METEAAMADSNLAERLIQDLEDSAAVFVSRSMTAGFPLQQHFANLPTDKRYPYRQQQHPERLHLQSQPIVTKTRPLSLMIGDTQGLPTVADVDEQDDMLKLAGECSDTASDSSLGMVPPSIRTREQSVTTAATSISGRCSSLLSQQPHSPSSITHARTERKFHGSWFDTEADHSQESHIFCTSETKIITSPLQSPLTSSGFENSTMDSISPDGIARPSSSAAFAAPVRLSSPVERPHTSAGQSFREKPRIIEIQPQVAVPKRSSSLKRPFQQFAPTSPTISYQEPFTRYSANTNEGDAADTETSLLVSHSSTLPLLATPTGRTVIDASRASSLELPYRERAHRRIPTISSPSQIVQSPLIGDDDTLLERDMPNPREPTQKPAPVDVRSWLDSSVESNPSQNFRFVPSTSMPAIPLPPEVIETLRISISCFPETMLLTSSLSIETIRTYSRKLRQPMRRPDNLPDDDQSTRSSSGNSTKQRKRWNLSGFMHSRGGKRDQSSWPAMEALGTLDSPQSEMPTCWASIKNIFPTGSAHLCDALYAHLVAYNYISTLCPLPQMPSSATMPGSILGTSDSESYDGGRKVPKKAASLLGLNDTATDEYNAAVNMGHRRGMSGMFGFGNGHKISSRNRGNASSTNGSALRDIQAGLSRCISQLVVTIKLTTGESAVGKGTMSAEMIDPLLMRALCEVVRCSEEVV